MRLLIFGAGSIGSFFGAMLSKAHDVVLVGRKDHVAAIRAMGLRVEGLDKGTYKLEAVQALSELKKGGPFDLILVTVKSPDTAEAAKSLSSSRGLFGKGTCVVSVQNGLDNVRILTQHFGERVLVTLTSHGVLTEGPGTIVHTGRGDTVVGWPTFIGKKKKGPEKEGGGGKDEISMKLAEALNEAGIEARVSDDMCKEMWLKAMVNAGINPVCAIAGLENGCLHDVPELRPVWTAAVREVAAVARSEGIDIKDDEALKRTRTVAEMTRENKCSMLQDVERGRRTEVDSITGFVVRIGERNSVPVPINTALLGLVKGIERTYLH